MVQQKKFHFIQEKSGGGGMPIGRLVCLLAGSGILVSVKSMGNNGTINPDTFPPPPPKSPFHKHLIHKDSLWILSKLPVP